VHFSWLFHVPESKHAEMPSESAEWWPRLNMYQNNWPSSAVEDALRAQMQQMHRAWCIDVAACVTRVII
jgi:hypothetical protein